MGFVRWLKNIWDEITRVPADEVDREKARDETFDPERSLYDLGYELCTEHPGGILDTCVQTFGQGDMRMLVERWFEHHDVDTDDVRDLDRLLEESEPSFGEHKVNDIYTDIPVERKVHELRQVFFDMFAEDDVSSLIMDIYDEEREDFGVGELFDPYATDHSVFTYEYPVSDPQPVSPPVSEDAEFPVDDMTFETESKELMSVGAGIDVVEQSVSKRVREFVTEQASMAWDALDVGGSFIDTTEIEEELLDAHDEVVESNFRPDLIVWDGTCPIGSEIFGLSNVIDETGVQSVPFIVTDSDRVGYEVTARDVEVECDRTMSPNPNEAYTLTWMGNYVVTDDGAYAVP